ncbi:MAG: pyridoxine 5'-phosphate synthase [Candidatus Omnitrophota bacterium]|nr:pyridoxine 5'-phosphate synthase [Candidatus Omnitrophota bacterium]
MLKLGVNIDHVATLRQARGGSQPDVIKAALACEAAGADSIVAHLREDRRHINDADVKKLRRLIKTRLNLEMSIAPEIVRIACSLRPDQATLVPERRQELTTEGGLDTRKNFKRVKEAVSALEARKIEISLFIDPDTKQIEAALETGAKIIELHTGRYANAKTSSERRRYLLEIENASSYAGSLGLVVNAGHGLDYQNVSSVARIGEIEELNIGHSIISRAVFIGLARAVEEMKMLIG